jgi:hypothetical protein
MLRRATTNYMTVMMANCMLLGSGISGGRSKLTMTR